MFTKYIVVKRTLPDGTLQIIREIPKRPTTCPECGEQSLYQHNRILLSKYQQDREIFNKRKDIPGLIYTEDAIRAGGIEVLRTTDYLLGDDSFYDIFPPNIRWMLKRSYLLFEIQKTIRYIQYKFHLRKKDELVRVCRYRCRTCGERWEIKTYRTFYN